MPNNTGRRFKFSMRILIGVLIALLFISYAIYARLANHGSNHSQINILVPWGLMAVFISFYLFGEFNRVKKARREERREYMNERRQEILNKVIKEKNKNTNTKND